VDKAAAAQQAGAALLVLVSNESTPFALGPANASLAPTLVLANRSSAWGDGSAVLDAVQGRSPAVLTVAVEPQPIFGWTEVYVLLVAVGLVWGSAAYGSADVVATHGELSEPPEDLVVMEPHFAAVFAVSASGMLVFLFFFIKYAVYLVYALFAFSSFKATVDVASSLVVYAKPSSAEVQRCWRRFCPSDVEVTRAHMLVGGPAALCVILFLTLPREDGGWLFQDVLAGALLPLVQRTLRTPNLKVIAIFLVVAFFFDIFWVFLSGNFFGKSVMVEVATGGSSGVPLPLVLLFPTGTPWSPWRALGLGDLALPGILISYVMRVDWKMGRRRYWPAVLVGYALGLCSAFLALAIMQQGQPALLYIVPGVLVPTVAKAAYHGELGQMWEGRLGRRAEDEVAEGGNLVRP
jgi:signal peptide peptidase-like protein 2B